MRTLYLVLSRPGHGTNRPSQAGLRHAVRPLAGHRPRRHGLLSPPPAAPCRRSGINFCRAPARVFAFPKTGLAPAWASRTWWTGAAAAAVVVAVMGSAVHLWTGVPTVNAPVVATAPAVSTPPQRASATPASQSVVAANSAPRRLSPRPVSRSEASRPEASQPQVASAATSNSPVLSAKASSARPAIAYGENSNYDSTPVTQLSPMSRRSCDWLARERPATWPSRPVPPGLDIQILCTVIPWSVPDPCRWCISRSRSGRSSPTLVKP